MESAGRRVGLGVVGVFTTGGIHVVDDRTRLPDQAESLSVHIHHVYHMDRNQLVRRILDVVHLR